MGTEAEGETMSQSFVKGALLITLATLVSKVLGSVFRIPLQNIAGDEVLGIFTAVYPVYMTVLTMSVAGIPLAISKLISEARVKNQSNDVRDIFVTSGILAFLFGLTSFLLMYIFAKPIAEALGGEYAMLSIIVVSLTLLIAPYMAVYRGYFQGFGTMTPTALSQVLEQFVRVALILIAAYVLVARQAPNETIAAGVMVGSSIGALCSLIYLRLTFTRGSLKPKADARFQFASFKIWAKRILVISLPICVGALTMALLNVVDSLTIPAQLRASGLSDQEIQYSYGLYGRGLALVQIAVVFASALILPLIPSITATLAKGEKEKARSLIEKANKFTHLVSWPAAIGLFALTLPINLALFKDLEGNSVIAVLSLSAVFTAISVLTTGILQGMNKEKIAAVVVVVSVFVKAVLNIVLFNQFGLLGAAIATLLTYIVLSVINLSYIYRTMPFTIISRGLVVSIVGSVLMGAVVYAPLYFLDVSGWSRMLALLYVALMIGVGAIVYMIVVLALKGLTREELQSLPFVGKLMRGNSSHSSTKRKDGQPLLKKILWTLVIVSIIASIPLIYERVKVEQENTGYELVVPYDQMISMVEASRVVMSEEKIFQQLHDAGIRTIAIEPLTIRTLAEKGIVSRVTALDILHEHADSVGELPEIPGMYLQVFDEESPFYKQMLEHVAYEMSLDEYLIGDAIETFRYEDKQYLFIPYEHRGFKTPIGFDFNEIEKLTKAGFQILPRLENTYNFIEEENHYIYDELNRLHDTYGVNKLLFSGTDVVGFGKTTALKTFAKQMKELGFAPVTIDFNDQDGMLQLLSYGKMREDVVRLFSMGIGKGTEKSAVPRELDKAIRAYKERNIRLLFMNPLKRNPDVNQHYQHPEEALKGLEALVALGEGIQAKIGSENNGVASPYGHLQQPLWAKLIIGIGIAAFIGLFVQGLLPKLSLVAVIATLLIYIGYLGTGMGMLLKGLALIVTIVAAMYAVFSARQVNGTKGILITYVKSAFIGLIGAWFVISMLYGTEYLVKTDYFRGVKVLSALPLLIGVPILLGPFFKWLLAQPIRYWHAAVLAVVGAVLLFYVMRTGNEGVILPFEAQFRQLLEDVLYVRPRTSEFLVGFPLFMLGIYLTSKKKRFAPLFLAFGFIAFASMVGTFTHLHTPVLISALRTFYSLVLGGLFGGVLIGIYMFAEKKLYPLIKGRLG